MTIKKIVSLTFLSVALLSGCASNDAHQQTKSDCKVVVDGKEQTCLDAIAKQEADLFGKTSQDNHTTEQSYTVFKWEW